MCGELENVYERDLQLTTSPTNIGARSLQILKLY